jgi:hypothetical protein
LYSLFLSHFCTFIRHYQPVIIAVLSPAAIGVFFEVQVNSCPGLAGIPLSFFNDEYQINSANIFREKSILERVYGDNNRNKIKRA